MPIMSKKSQKEKEERLLFLEMPPEGFEAPWGVYAKGVVFPTLEKVATDFANENHLNLKEIVYYNTKSDRDSIPLEELHQFGGKILQLDEGLVILTSRYEIHSPDDLEIVAGGPPRESYKSSYILSGKLYKKEVHLEADVVFDRSSQQIVKTSRLPPYRKRIVNEPAGAFSQSVYRWDNSKLWFIVPPNKRTKSSSIRR